MTGAAAIMTVVSGLSPARDFDAALSRRGGMCGEETQAIALERTGYVAREMLGFEVRRNGCGVVWCGWMK